MQWHFENFSKRDKEQNGIFIELEVHDVKITCNFKWMKDNIQKILNIQIESGRINSV